MHRQWVGMAAVALLAVVLAGPPAAAGMPAEQMLASYVNAPDPAFKWEAGPVGETAGMKVSDLILTSQQWQGITWRHMLRVFSPPKPAYAGWMALYITGGTGAPVPGKGLGEDAVGVVLAQTLGMPVAMLYHVPNAPLFGGLTEDGITGYSFVEYLKTGDPTWPVHFPMAKSGVRAMDALQAWSRQSGQEVGSFLVVGASKRGWTTWLVAVADGGRRVKAIAPLVFDALNLLVQFRHSLELWGHYSEAIYEFTNRNLVQEAESNPRLKEAWTAVDPYTYRDRLTLPKLVVNATMDPFYATDATNLYWEGLKGPKYLLYAPNSGHGLDDRTRVFNTLGAFARAVAGGKRMPQMSWERKVEGSRVTITIRAPEAKGARAWFTKASNLDFRLKRWESVPMTGEKGVFTATLERPAELNMAVFGEADFELEGRPFTLSTQNVLARK